MREKSKLKKILKGISTYIICFLLIAFLVTCCMMLFITTMTRSMELNLTDKDIALAAKLTMGNVILLSLAFTVIDTLRRKLTVERQVKQISMVTNQICKGNFKIRIPKNSGFAQDESFGEIIEDINRMADELSGIETLRTDFISNVSHELKTPLAVMQNYATMLSARSVTEEERIEYSKAIMQSAKRLANLIANILKLNKLENQKIFPEATEYDLGEQLCECLLLFEDIWEEKGIEIETELEENVKISTDSELFSIVWNNLFSNAFKFTENNGTVKLKLATEGEYAIVSVSDTGCGMNKTTGEHIFDKFYQGDTSHATQGNGLGLSLVKRIMDITKSDICVDSELGKGTTFTVRIKRRTDGKV